MINAGYGWSAIGKKLNRAPGGVANHARDYLGLNYSPLPKSQSRKRPERPSEYLQKPPEKPDEIKRRKCLGCGDEFDSKWIGNRLCKQCNISEARRGSNLW
jgi:hypothetical protein